MRPARPAACYLHVRGRARVAVAGCAQPLVHAQVQHKQRTTNAAGGVDAACKQELARVTKVGEHGCNCEAGELWRGRRREPRHAPSVECERLCELPVAARYPAVSHNNRAAAARGGQIAPRRRLRVPGCGGEEGQGPIPRERWPRRHGCEYGGNVARCAHVGRRVVALAASGRPRPGTVQRRSAGDLWRFPQSKARQCDPERPQCGPEARVSRWDSGVGAGAGPAVMARNLRAHSQLRWVQGRGCHPRAEPATAVGAVGRPSAVGSSGLCACRAARRHPSPPPPPTSGCARACPARPYSAPSPPRGPSPACARFISFMPFHMDPLARGCRGGSSAPAPPVSVYTPCHWGCAARRGPRKRA